MERTLAFTTERLFFYLATEEDRALIHQMAFEDDAIWQQMFTSKDDFTLEEVEFEPAEFFSGDLSPNKYVLIATEDQIIGTIAHTYHHGKITNMELDIWFRNHHYTGKGYGQEALRGVINFLTQVYDIQTYLMRPWRKNETAVAAYKKVGFHEIKDFDIRDYYEPHMLIHHGDGDYGKETVNLVLTHK
ncbi:GNAT family N-acetyltransferase [Geomicrobium sp. JCM 19038]|uniref:GNAT family N-acetyltransferase n=1 Tax=Geomicrobium sp. JCM 19038 TaxID=1460635 RepID=UPI00045F3ED4|nr:GNAT family N-acetyltransferase [Geomicrobium sp. JCM 19038]GAK06827.1 hypothetical protein JCM19038_536 [Geomicrobium sp. JCM 19038]